MQPTLPKEGLRHKPVKDEGACILEYIRSKTEDIGFWDLTETLRTVGVGAGAIPIVVGKEARSGIRNRGGSDSQLHARRPQVCSAEERASTERLLENFF